jgi:hypothetical protein
VRQECAGREPKHGNCLDKCCGPLGRPHGIDEGAGDEEREREAEVGLEQFERKLGLNGEDVEGGN